MLNKKLKYAQRYNEIIKAFLRNGFGYIMQDLGLTEALSFSLKKDKAYSNIDQKTIGERLRNLLQELGTTFIKLGQLASTRRDIFPEGIISELEKLQTKVSPFPFSQVRETFEKELQTPIEHIFETFSEEPFATGSIGQVHLAKLKSGETAAVKVQRPNIQSVIETDLEILYDIAKLMDSKLDWAKKYNLLEVIDELSQSILQELDFSIEGKNAEKIGKQFKQDETVHIPKIYWEYSTKKVLTMEYLKGIQINNVAKLDEIGIDRKKIAEKFAQCMFEQILLNGYFHGDPHPGNVIVMGKGTIGLLDFGNVGHLNENMRKTLVSFLINLQKGDSEKLVQVLLQMGLAPKDINYARLQSDVEKIRDSYYDRPLGEISIGDVINDMFSTIMKYNIQIPAEYTILGRSLVTIEGIISYLDPTCNIFEIIEPYTKTFMKEYHHPKNFVKTSIQEMMEWKEFMSSLPKTLKKLIGTAESGEFYFKISMPELNLMLKKLDEVINRLSFAIVLLAFSIVMVGLIIGSSLSGEDSLLWKFPIIEIGAIIASLMFLFLLFSIFRSGKF